MAKSLVIVESPAKVKTIKKFLGSKYEVAASMGHVRDLPKSQLGIDVEHDYEPKYITIRGKGELLASLRKLVKKADKVYLATDPDREGEAISWHLITALGLQDLVKQHKVFRITFNEITKSAVTEAIKHPREINTSLVDAQQTRRILDRMVGYRISPLLWAKVKRGLSAGRVQSVALRMIADREDEINSFIPEEYWTLDVDLKAEGEKKPLTAHYFGTLCGSGKDDAGVKSDSCAKSDKAEKVELKTGDQVDAICAELEKADFAISEIRRSERERKAPLPFTTSTLQQEASKVLNFPTSKTMRIAQQLYEGVDIKGQGSVGIITYLRTDSTRISDEALAASAEYIKATYGEEYLAADTAKNGNKNGANGAANGTTGAANGTNGSTAAGAAGGDAQRNVQDAHEAIRPTDITRTPESIKDSLDRDSYRLYQLIWKRFTASRMASARYEQTQVRITAKRHLFTAPFSRITFQGFLSVYNPEDEEKAVGLSKGITEDTKISLIQFDKKQHFTQPAPHYTEASLVRALEEQGIGRPSTYAPTISTILARRYIVKEQKNLYMTELGEAVNNIMKQSFATIVDPTFTANLETLLDGIADGTVKWKTVIENFYPDLDEAVKAAEKEQEKVSIADEESDEICEKCGRRMVYKYGQYGKFLACPGFPECRNTRPYFEKIGVACPKCGKDIVIKKTAKGRRYYGCLGNPECDFMVWQRPSDQKCPRCGGIMLEKGNKLVCADESCGYQTDMKKEQD